MLQSRPNCSTRLKKNSSVCRKLVEFEETISIPTSCEKVRTRNDFEKTGHLA